MIKFIGEFSARRNEPAIEAMQFELNWLNGSGAISLCTGGSLKGS